MPPAYWSLPSALATVVALSLAAYATLTLPHHRWQVAGACLATAVTHGAYGVSLLAPQLGAFPLHAAYGGGVAHAALVVVFTRSLLARLERRPPAPTELLVPLGAALALIVALTPPIGLFELAPFGDGRIAAGTVGQIACGGVLLLHVWGLANLEELLRRTRDPLRYQMKFLFLGQSLLAVLALYITSSFLLEPVWNPDLTLAHSTTALLGLALSAASLARLRHRTVWAGLTDASPTSAPLSFGIAGTFLVVTGAASALVPRTTPLSHHVAAVALTAATGVALAVLLASRYVRTALSRFIARTLKRSKYDYRRKWLDVVAAFHGVTTVEAILDRFLDLLGQTFSARHISVWLRSAADGHLHQVRSLNVEAAPAPLPASHWLVVAAASSPEVLRLDTTSDEDPAPFIAASTGVVGPLWGDALLGLVVLGQELRDTELDQDDVDLLQAISSHVGTLIAHARLAEEHRADAQLRALHELSIFCIHDLKNLAGRLSLVAQNARRFGDDPEFQRSALRTVGTTVERMTSLIHKLSPGAAAPVEAPAGEARADVFAALAAVTETVRAGLTVRISPPLVPPPLVCVTQEALENVLLNIVTNAEQALGETGEIDLTVTPAGATCTIAVRDSGPGLAPDALAEVFEPFRTTKRSGLGVGLYQCKKTIEAAGGTITVTSELGRGTTVTLRLPQPGGAAR